MSIDNLAALLEAVKGIARDAGEKIMAIYGTAFKVERKSDDSPLTKADMAAHHCIVDALDKLADYPVLSEESGSIPFSERRAWQTYWLVDPLDGTKEFVKRNGDFTVNIALILQLRPVLGVVYVPVTRQCYFAAQGLGACKQGEDSPAQAIRVRTRVPEKLVVAGSRSHVTPELQNYLARLPAHELLSIGSSLKFCLVAEGRADLYPRMGLTSEWDTAAAQCVVEQAGGLVTDLQGRELRYNEKESLLNPCFLVFGDRRVDWAGYAKN